jgi:hypothetical protein
MASMNNAMVSKIPQGLSASKRVGMPGADQVGFEPLVAVVRNGWKANLRD